MEVDLDSKKDQLYVEELNDTSQGVLRVLQNESELQMPVFSASLRSWDNDRAVLQIKWWQLGITAEHKLLMPMSACALQTPGFVCPFWCKALLLKMTFEQLVMFGNFCFTDQKLKNKETKSYIDKAPSFH